MKHTLVLLVTTVALACSLAAQQDLPDRTSLTLKSNVNEVRLAFAATDSSGRVAKELSAADVTVVDNGVTIRNFRSFRPAAEVPLNLVILVDSSASVAAEFPRVVAELNQFFASAKLGSNDHVSLLVFGGSWPTLICAMKCANDKARLPLKGIRATGSTPLYDALVEAAKLVTRQQAPEARPAVILFSDGFDTISLSGAQDALDALERTDAAIYAKSVSNRKRMPEGEALLVELTEETGGLRYPAKRSVDETLSAVVQDLRKGFVLTYELPRTEVEQHTVQVLAANPPGLTIRSRTSYRVPKPRPEQDRDKR